MRVEEARVLLGLRPGFSESELAEAVRSAEDVWRPDRFEEGSERHQAAIARSRTLAQARMVLEKSREEPGPTSAEEAVDAEPRPSVAAHDDAEGEPVVVAEASLAPPAPEPMAERVSGHTHDDRSTGAQPTLVPDPEPPPGTRVRGGAARPRLWMAGAAVVSVALVAWFVSAGLLTRPTTASSGGQEGAVDAFPVADEAVITEAGGARPENAADDGADPESTAADGEIDQTGEGMSFSVSLGAFRSFASAQALAGRIAEESTVSWFAVAPVATAGGVYHRVLAGLVPDSTQAAALGAQLAQRLGGDVSGWFARPVALMVCSSSFPDASGAQQVLQAALAQEMAGSIRSSPAGSDALGFRACFGAYGRPDEAGEAIRRLSEAGYRGRVASVVKVD